MKTIVMGFLISLAAACTTASYTPPASDNETQQTDEQNDLVEPRTRQCENRMGTCETGSFCHDVGINIGRFDCPAPLICCV